MERGEGKEERERGERDIVYMHVTDRRHIKRDDDDDVGDHSFCYARNRKLNLKSNWNAGLFLCFFFAVSVFQK